MSKLSQAPSRRSAKLFAALGAAAALIAPLTGAFVAPAKATTVACYALERNCLTRAAKSRQFLGKLESNASTIRQDALDSFCYDSSAQAKATGVWPAYEATPAIACSN